MATGRTFRPGGSSRHEGRAPLPGPSIGRNPVCATINPGAAAFWRAERALALAAAKPAPCEHAAAHDCQLLFWRPQAQPASSRPGRELATSWEASRRPFDAHWRQAARAGLAGPAGRTQSALGRPHHRPEPCMRNHQPRRRCLRARGASACPGSPEARSVAHAAAHEWQLQLWRAQAQPASLHAGRGVAARWEASRRPFDARWQ